MEVSESEPLRRCRKREWLSKLWNLNVLQDRINRGRVFWIDGNWHRGGTNVSQGYARNLGTYRVFHR